MHKPIAAPLLDSPSGLPPSERTTRATPPRCRLHGGDTPRGGHPASVGHAGRTKLQLLVYTVLLVLFTGTSMALNPSVASAGVGVRFANGGEAQIESDGSITGIAHLGDFDDEKGEHFAVTMPDGTKTFGWCLDLMHYAPASGDYPFVAKPKGNGSYEVTIDSTKAKPGRQPFEGLAYLDPPQRVGNFEWKPEFMGWLKVTKVSSLPDLTSGNAAYKLEGARFTVWSDKDCTNKVSTEKELITNSKGETEEIALAPGTYWVKEESAPTGYKTAVDYYKTTIVGQKSTELEVKEKPEFESPDVWATKVSAEYSSPNGQEGIAGAEFTIRYYDGIYELSSLPAKATRHWVVTSDANGNVFPSKGNLKSGSDLYVDNKGNVILPRGTVTIQETKAPKGYLLEGQTEDSPDDYQAPIHLTTVTGNGSYKTPAVKDHPRKAGISLQKADSQTDTKPQGDASLAGMAFSIVNANEGSVVVGGVTYGPGETIGEPLVTDESGVAATSSNYLPLGTYEVRETSSNGSMVASAKPQTITLTSKHANEVVALKNHMTNDVVRGGICVGKISAETGDHTAQGEASLAGATFTITLQSAQPVVVGNSTFKTGDVVQTLVTDQVGMASTNTRELPYGTYVVREVEASPGYLLNGDWSATVQIREDGVVHDLTAPADSTPEQVMRGGFSFNKVDENSMERMASVAWRITSDTTGESHVIVADENGIVDTEAIAHSAQTNANDAALRDDGSIDEQSLSSEAGVWFSGRNDVVTLPNDKMRALPYDVYTVEELSSSANEGHELVSFKVRVHSHGRHINMGTVDNKPTTVPSIGTTLTHLNDSHVAPVGEHVTITDTVTYQNLRVGEEYTLVGRLVNKQTGEAIVGIDGQEITQTTTFTPFMTSGSIQMTFEIDSRLLEGTSVVAFEDLVKDGISVAVHAELEDEGQTVSFPSIGTSLTSTEGERVIRADEHIELVDVVSYNNLLPNVAYEVRGCLMDKDTSAPLEDQNGRQILATASFVPEEPQGTVEVSFSLDGELVRGKTLVAFEALLHAGIEVARHEDIEDVGQTVRIVDIQTELTDQEGHHAVSSLPSLTLVDTITYRGLEPGVSYDVVGALMDKRTGEPLKDADGNEIQATGSFTPETPTGSTSVSFVVDTTLVVGREIVAFESLQKDGIELAIHADLEDQAQTVHVPSVGTTLTSEACTHETCTGKNILTDVVAYDGLRPGIPHTLHGVLMCTDTKEPLRDKDGNEYHSEVEFTPDSPDGTVDVSFEIDVTGLSNPAIVAFEYLYEGNGTEGRMIASHEDAEDLLQTVSVPSIATSATDAQDGDKTVESSDTMRVKDTVSYKGLEPGATYVMSGTLQHLTDGKPLKTKDGVVVSAEISFVPEQPDGTVELMFEFDADLVQDEDLVAFESCRRNDIEVAVHADLADKEQTVHVKRPSEPTKPSVPGTPTTVSTNPEQKSVTHEYSTRSTPSTGDTNRLPLIAAIAVLGISLLVARRFLT